MPETPWHQKPWLKSRTIWLWLFIAAIGILGFFGINIDLDTLDVVTTDGLNPEELLKVAVAIVGFYVRKTTSSTISGLTRTPVK